MQNDLNSLRTNIPAERAPYQEAKTIHACLQWIEKARAAMANQLDLEATRQHVNALKDELKAVRERAVSDNKEWSNLYQTTDSKLGAAKDEAERLLKVNYNLAEERDNDRAIASDLRDEVSKLQVRITNGEYENKELFHSLSNREAEITELHKENDRIMKEMEHMKEFPASQELQAKAAWYDEMVALLKDRI